MEGERSQLLTVRETAQRLRVSPQTVYRLAQRQELPSLRVGRAVRFDADEVDRSLRETQAAK